MPRLSDQRPDLQFHVEHPASNGAARPVAVRVGGWPHRGRAVRRCEAKDVTRSPDAVREVDPVFVEGASPVHVGILLAGLIRTSCSGLLLVAQAPRQQQK